MPRRITASRIKSNRSYTVEQAAETLDVTQQTIRAWIKSGLPVLNTKRPTLIMGFALKDFVQTRREGSKRPLDHGEMYCLGCKAVTAPALGMIDYIPLSNSHGMVRGFCANCERTCTRIIRGDDLPRWMALSAD